MSELVLGLDGGGTQTRALAADLAGNIAGAGQAGPCSLSALSAPEALTAALAAADAALQEAGMTRADVVSLCAGVAGYSLADRRRQFRDGLRAAFPQAAVAVEPDYIAALTGATNGRPGVIVIAGTGSAACGENAAGETHRTGAYGLLIDDGGSGYGVGRAALAAVLAAADGTGPETTLSERILAQLQLSAVAEVVPGVYGGTVGRVEIAALSRTVAEAAADGDPAARTLLMGAGGALARLAHGVTRRLFADADAPFPVVPVGGLWGAGDALTDVFARSLRRFAPWAMISAPAGSPAEGAVRRARAGLGGPQKNSSPP